MAPKLKPISEEERLLIIRNHVQRVPGLTSVRSLALHFHVDEMRVERILSEAGVWDGDNVDYRASRCRAVVRSEIAFSQAMARQTHDYSGPLHPFAWDLPQDEGPWTE